MNILQGGKLAPPYLNNSNAGNLINHDLFEVCWPDKPSGIPEIVSGSFNLNGEKLALLIINRAIILQNRIQLHIQYFVVRLGTSGFFLLLENALVITYMFFFYSASSPSWTRQHEVDRPNSRILPLYCFAIATTKITLT